MRRDGYLYEVLNSPKAIGVMMRYLWDEAHGGHYSISGPFEQCKESEVVAASDYAAIEKELADHKDLTFKSTVALRALEADLEMQRSISIQACARNASLWNTLLACRIHLATPAADNDDLAMIDQIDAAMRGENPKAVKQP